MAKITKPLTNTEVKQAKPKDKVYTLSDGDGLQLRIKPNGTNLGYLTTEDRTQKNAPALALVHSQNYHLPKHEANEKKLENY